MLLVKSLKAEITDLYERRTALGSDFSDFEKKKLGFLLRLFDYTKSLLFLSHAGLRQKFQDFLRSSCSYRVTAQKYGVSLKSMHDSIRYVDRCLKYRIGSSFQLVCQDDLDGAEREFAVGTGSAPSVMFMRDVEEQFRPVQASGVDLGSCRNEIRFLSLYSKRYLDLVLGHLDRQKIQHLLFILNNTEMSYVTPRGVLFRYLEGELELDAAVALLKNGVTRSVPTISDEEQEDGTDSSQWF
ncbi:MAG: hypothetical protein E6Y08_08545 [Paenibacillus sp.]|uniref:hypothetical protein n=1 Tax=Paenibacillus sp. TaxID=58172 RepID=UPI00290DABB2|nr:hypothetical protein [Paenibacillus sp.]MDU4695851.1 hypothetical protein [Paenibacillus sp.]